MNNIELTGQTHLSLSQGRKAVFALCSSDTFYDLSIDVWY